MSLFEKYRMKKSSEFTRLVGVNYGTFQIILQKVEAEITRYRQQNPMRQRGRKSSLTVADQLLLTLIYLRQYHTFLQLAEMFSISESYAQKRYTFISKRLLTALDVPDEKSLTAENLTVIGDVTEQEIERPLKKQKSYYSGKKKGTPSKLSCLSAFSPDSSLPSDAPAARHMTLSCSQRATSS